MYHYNLLPKEAQKRTKRWMIIKQVTIGIAVLNVFVFACSGVLWNANKGLHTLITTTEAQAQQSIGLRSERSTTYDIDAINQQIQALRSIQQEHVNLLALIKTLAEAFPTGTTASRISIDVTGRKITLTGVAQTREDLQRMRELLQQQTLFTITSFPYEALTQPENIEFQILLNFQSNAFTYD